MMAREMRKAEVMTQQEIELKIAKQFTERVNELLKKLETERQISMEVEFVIDDAQKGTWHLELKQRGSPSP